MTNKVSFDRTRAALEEYDRTRPERDKLWFDEASMTSLEVAQNADREAVDKVQAAFLEDTKEFNSPNHAKMVHPDDEWLRRLIRGAK